MSRSSPLRWSARFLVGLVTVASVLVPAWAAPSRTISIPLTEAMSIQFPGSHSSGFTTPMEAFAIAPTHVAFVWSGGPRSGVLYRSRSASGVSPWRRAPEADDLRHGDVHYSGVLSVEGVTAMQWQARVPPGQKMGTVTLHYMNTMDGPRVTEQVPAVAQALAHTPHIVTRAEWGADESLKRIRGGCERHFYPVQQIFVHHTAGTNFDPHPRATMRAIYYFHVKVRGWCDIGYNFVIAPGGTIFEGRWARDYAPWEVHTSESRSGQGVMGAHVLNFNAGSIGISLMGNYSLIRVPPAMQASLTRLLAWEADRHHLWPTHWHTYRSPDSSTKRWLPYIAGHRDAFPTACPGNYAYALLPALRDATAALIGSRSSKRNSRLTLQSSPPDVNFGDRATVTGKLTSGLGTPVPSASVHLYIRRTSGLHWREVTVRTSKDGTFAYRPSPQSNIKVDAVFPGERHLWGSQSKVKHISVTPLLGLSAVGGTTDGDGVVHYPAGTTTVDFTGALDPPHPGLSVRVRILSWQPGQHTRLASIWSRLGAAGHFSSTFHVPHAATGTYRAVAMFPSDGDHTTARSEPLFFAIDP